MAFSSGGVCSWFSWGTEDGARATQKMRARLKKMLTIPGEPSITTTSSARRTERLPTGRLQRADSSAGRASVLQTEGRRFETCSAYYAEDQVEL